MPEEIAEIAEAMDATLAQGAEAMEAVLDKEAEVELDRHLETLDAEKEQQLSSTLEAAELCLADPSSKTIAVTIIKPSVVEDWGGKINYGEQVLRDSVPLWDGAACFSDHFDKRVKNLAGVYYAPYYEDGVKAKLRLTDDNLYKMVCQLIQDREEGLPVPDIGISADINVAFSQGEESIEVTKITRVVSADIVFMPAAGGSLDRILNSCGISATLSEQNASEPGSSPSTDTAHGHGEPDEELVPVSRVRDLQSANDKLRAELKGKDTLNHRLAGAVGKYREALLLAHSVIPEELIKGESIEELDVSLAQAQAVVEKIKNNIEEADTIPAGAPARTGTDLSEMSSVEKIKRGLHQK